MEKQGIQEKPFFNATKDVFKSMLDIDIAPSAEENASPSKDHIRIEIDLVGDLSGAVVYDFPKLTTLNIVKTLSGMDAEEIDDFATSMLGEMANIISGNAVSYLSEMNCQCDIKPPKITVGVESGKEAGSSAEIRFTSPVGKLSEHILLSESNPG